MLVKAVLFASAIATAVLVSCASGQTVDGPDSISLLAGGHKHDSGVNPPSGQGGSPVQNGTGGSSMAMGGADPGMSSGGASVGGSGGTSMLGNGGASSGGTPDASSGGAGGTGGMTGSGGSTQSAGGTCASGQKVCAGACVTQVPANGCSATSCSACPIPAPPNGLQTCDDQGQCNFECLSGYQRNGTLCTMGGGGSAGAGGSPTMCGNDRCGRCFGNLIGCCNQQGDHCLCVFPNQTGQCGP